MAIECDFSKPEEVLQAFWTEMQMWELNASKTSSQLNTPETIEQLYEFMRTSWKPIFEKYCTSKKRAYGEYRALGIYAKKDEKILEINYTSAKRVVVKTQQVQKVKKELVVMGEYFYVLLKQGDKWLLDHRYFYSSGKVVRGTL